MSNEQVQVITRQEIGAKESQVEKQLLERLLEVSSRGSEQTLEAQQWAAAYREFQTAISVAHNRRSQRS